MYVLPRELYVNVAGDNVMYLAICMVMGQGRLSLFWLPHNLDIDQCDGIVFVT